MGRAPLRLLAEGVSTELCDAVALLTLRCIGIVAGSRLTPAAEEMLLAAVDEQTEPDNLWPRDGERDRWLWTRRGGVGVQHRPDEGGIPSRRLQEYGFRWYYDTVTHLRFAERSQIIEVFQCVWPPGKISLRSSHAALYSALRATCFIG